MSQPRKKNGQFTLKKERLNYIHWINNIEPYAESCKECNEKMTYRGFIKFMGGNICERTFKTALKEGLGQELEGAFKRTKRNLRGCK